MSYGNGIPQSDWSFRVSQVDGSKIGRDLVERDLVEREPFERDLCVLSGGRLVLDKLYFSILLLPWLFTLNISP